jgi:hypothetical protein
VAPGKKTRSNNPLAESREWVGETEIPGMSVVTETRWVDGAASGWRRDKTVRAISREAFIFVQWLNWLKKISSLTWYRWTNRVRD